MTIIQKGELMGDLISRQAAIDVMCELMHHWFGGDPKDEIREIKRELEKLPSAQPVAKDINVPAKDCISRQAAIDECYPITVDGEVYEVVQIETLMGLPSAQPEREWIPCSNPPKHHRNVIVRGTELFGNRTVHKVMQWDVDTWRPTDYAPSIRWEEWSEI